MTDERDIRLEARETHSQGIKSGDIRSRLFHKSRFRQYIRILEIDCEEEWGGLTE